MGRGLEAMLLAERTAAVYVTDERALGRYASKSGANGATLVRNARKDREAREASYGERQRQQRAKERQDFLNNRSNTPKKGEGMRDNHD